MECSWAPITKDLTAMAVRPNLVDYARAAGRRAKVALRWLGRRGQLRELTHADLAAVSKRCANMLAGPGIGAGERVFACCERVPGGPAAIYGAHALEALRQFEQRA